VKEAGLAGRTLLDIGGGVGAVHLGLLSAGAGTAVDVDASSAFLRVARAEAGKRGLADRITYRFGNFVEMAAEVAPADIVTLDRVVCCYHDVEALLGLSARRAASTLGMVFPRDTAAGRFLNRLLNLVYRLKGTPFRTFVHPYSRIEEVLRSAGLQRSSQQRTFFWQIEVFRRVRPLTA
jgi:ubiquinone/menaquinone biosynthesis C-methylase UbiE